MSEVSTQSSISFLIHRWAFNSFNQSEAIRGEYSQNMLSETFWTRNMVTVQQIPRTRFTKQKFIQLTPSLLGPEDSACHILRAFGKCTYGFVAEGKWLLQAYTWQLELPPLYYLPLWWPESDFWFFKFYFACFVVIFASWLLIKEGTIYILLHLKFWIGFWTMPVVVIKHLYNSNESQGSSGEEENGDIFPKCGAWKMTHAPSDKERSDLYLFLTV